MTVERWLPIPGYEASYDVSDQGHVRSRARGGLQVLRPGRMNRFGHVSVSLGRLNSRTVYSLVLEAFVGPRPVGCDAVHRNGSGGDNRLENLRWAPRSDNNFDISRHDRRSISRDLVVLVKSSSLNGVELSALMGISRSQISNIRRGKQRQHG